MLISYRLMQFIGDHCSQIAATAEKKVQSDPELRDLQNLPTAERRNRYETILKDLQSPRSDRELASRYEEMGRTRFEDRVPLHEVMRSLMILKATIFDLIRNQGFGRNPLELYAEGELEHRVGSSVDRMQIGRAHV